MSHLSFLSQAPNGPFMTWRAIIDSMVTGVSKGLEGLTPQQIEKIQISTRYLLEHAESERAGILSELECPDTEEICKLLKAYQDYLTKPTHQLKGFDWTVSVILGTNKVSNLKEPISTFRFDYEEIVNGKSVIKTRTIELTHDEAQAMCNDLEAARSAQTKLI